MEEACRLCGSDEGIRISIFEPGSEFVRKIHKILPISINEQDPFPKTMCHRCSFKVTEFFEFRSVCIRAQEVFKSKLPWLKRKECSKVDISGLPMVEVCMNSINSISPNEKLLACRSIESIVDENNSMIVIDDDSPSFSEESRLAELNEDDTLKIIGDIKRARRTKKSRSIWDTKKRRKKPQKECKIAEVYTTVVDDYQSLEAVENDPLCISSDKNIEEIDFAGQTDTSKEENDSLKNETLNKNITLPSYILVTNIPQVGLVYTCEKCARTFLSSQPASLHVCDCQANDDITSKEDKKGSSIKSVTLYKCDRCSQVFSRKSLLVSHKKTHVSTLSSSNETFTPTNQRKKHLKRGISKPTLLSGKNSFLINFNNEETEITRHSLLSSDSD